MMEWLGTRVLRWACALSVAAACLFQPQTAAAQSRQFCMILVLNGGTMRQSPDLFSLNSKIAGGQQARAYVAATNSSYSLSIHSPTTFSQYPSGFNESVDFESSMYGQGATDFSEVPDDTQVRLKRGWTLVQADLIATALTGTLMAGDYTAITTLRCE